MVCLTLRKLAYMFMCIFTVDKHYMLATTHQTVAESQEKDCMDIIVCINCQQYLLLCIYTLQVQNLLSSTSCNAEEELDTYNVYNIIIPPYPVAAPSSSIS